MISICVQYCNDINKIILQKCTLHKDNVFELVDAVSTVIYVSQRFFIYKQVHLDLITFLC